MARSCGAYAPVKDKVEKPKVPIKVPSVTISNHTKSVEALGNICYYMSVDRSILHKFMLYIGYLSSKVANVTLIIDDDQNRWTRTIPVRVGYNMLEVNREVGLGDRLFIELTLPEGKVNSANVKVKSTANNIYLSFLSTNLRSEDGSTFVVVQDASDVDVEEPLAIEENTDIKIEAED